jgi:hypothetical protein
MCFVDQNNIVKFMITRMCRLCGILSGYPHQYCHNYARIVLVTSRHLTVTSTSGNQVCYNFAPNLITNMICDICIRED